MSLDIGKVAVAMLGLLAYKNRDKITDLIRNQTTRNPDDSRSGGGLLDGILGGGAAGSGLQDVLDKFRGAGSGGEVNSWVGKDANKPLRPQQVEAAIDARTLDELSRQTGLTREELIDRITRDLPEVVDELTPEGKLPDAAASSPAGARPGGNLLDDVPTGRKGA